MFISTFILFFLVILVLAFGWPLYRGSWFRSTKHLPFCVQLFYNQILYNFRPYTGEEVIQDIEKDIYENLRKYGKMYEKKDFPSDFAGFPIPYYYLFKYFEPLESNDKQYVWALCTILYYLDEKRPSALDSPDHGKYIHALYERTQLYLSNYLNSPQFPAEVFFSYKR